MNITYTLLLTLCVKLKITQLKEEVKLGMTLRALAFSPSTGEVEAGGFL